jgi:hypothetical protein
VTWEPSLAAPFPWSADAPYAPAARANAAAIAVTATLTFVYEMPVLVMRARFLRRRSPAPSYKPETPEMAQGWTVVLADE